MGRAAWLIHSVAIQRTFFLVPTLHTHVCTLTCSLALSAWRLPLLQLTLVLLLQGETCAELLTLGLIPLLFPVNSVSSCRRLWKRQRTERRKDTDKAWPGFRGEEENIVNSHHLLTPAMFGVAKEIREFQALRANGFHVKKKCCSELHHEKAKHWISQ